MADTIQDRALKWLLTGETGTSSKTLCAHMLGIDIGHKFPPSDKSDRGRCIKLLNLIPEWWDRLDEMADLPVLEQLVFGSSGLDVRNEGWAEQIPLIKKEAVEAAA